MEWDFVGQIHVGDVAKEELCDYLETQVVLLTAVFQQWENCMHTCQKMKSRPPQVYTKGQMQTFFDLGLKIRKKPVKIWVPLHDHDQKGSFLDYYSKEPINSSAELKLSNIEENNKKNCAVYNSLLNGWVDWFCEVPVIIDICCLCQSPRIVYLKLRGLCSNSNIDPYYVISNDKSTTETVLYGIQSTTIDFDFLGNRWQLKVVGRAENTSGASAALHVSFLLGQHQWKIENDNKACKSGDSYVVNLKLTGCKDNEFTCSDGQCIKMTGRCDQIVNCRDYSDETDCSLLVLGKSYSKKVPPFLVHNMRENDEPVIIPAKVNVSITLMNIIKINEVDNLIAFKFGISLEWYEYRAVYNNLKPATILNSLSEDDINSLWVPHLIYENTDNNEALRIGGETETKVDITREGNFVRSGMDVAEEIEHFKGAENKLTLNQTYSTSFHCIYLIHYFPFDTQVLLYQTKPLIIYQIALLNSFDLC